MNSMKLYTVLPENKTMEELFISQVPQNDMFYTLITKSFSGHNDYGTGREDLSWSHEFRMHGSATQVCSHDQIHEKTYNTHAYYHRSMYVLP